MKKEKTKKYDNLSRWINNKIDLGLEIKTREKFLDDQLFTTHNDEIDKKRTSISKEAGEIWNKIKEYIDKLEECKKIKIY